ncbi:LysM peptidoglycan-binding domain-containing protein, partial [Paucilactobacillus nenjiangensis]|uniref:LysM peptidoglycan-binding domain-containing protein n=1 Tax=Paucilactobacillus nenjiangensis TaxID=1296540 RepID=UPI003BB0294F
MSKSVVTKALISTLGAAGVFVVGTQVANADTINIASGDTVSAYAAKYNVSIDDIVKANKLADANLIIAGHTIEIPGATSDATSEVASSAVADTTVASSAVESSAVASSAVADS